jgi:hypothetical protein
MERSCNQVSKPKFSLEEVILIFEKKLFLQSRTLTPKHPREPKWLFADLGRLL